MEAGACDPVPATTRAFADSMAARHGCRQVAYHRRNGLFRLHLHILQYDLFAVFGFLVVLQERLHREASEEVGQQGNTTMFAERLRESYVFAHRIRQALNFPSN